MTAAHNFAIVNVFYEVSGTGGGMNCLLAFLDLPRKHRVEEEFKLFNNQLGVGLLGDINFLKFLV